jgi:kynurenine formamidase
MPAEGDAPLYLDDLPNDLDGVEALLLRTGAHRLRDSYPQQYREKHPWLHPDAAERLRRLPRLKAIGFDFISAASPSSPEEGAAVHKTLLSPERPIMIMEDLDLSDGRLPERGWTLYIVPMFTADVESTPVTVLAVPL